MTHDEERAVIVYDGILTAITRAEILDPPAVADLRRRLQMEIAALRERNADAGVQTILTAFIDYLDTLES